MGASAPAALARQGAADYQESLQRSAREEWDTPEELLLDGARTNPYAAWEYGMALRLDGQLGRAKEMHEAAAQYFDDIGDRARSVISQLDAAIDAAAQAAAAGAPKKDAANQAVTAKALLQNAIARTTTVEGRDGPLLQRVIAKEGEARMALAALEWSTASGRQDAETQLTLTCQRLDQLEADALQQQRRLKQPETTPPEEPAKLSFTIDDLPGAFDISCTRLKSASYLKSRLEWPSGLVELAAKLNNLVTVQ
jgi:hypothetical protein